ncbi:unnamed protein product [Rhizophagus irregularis]|nr:unnamed protein product [Rhizophagus irregularis]
MLSCISFNFCFVSYHQCFELVSFKRFVIMLFIDMNQLQTFRFGSLSPSVFRYFAFSFGLVSWEVLKYIGYFFGTLDDISMTSQIMISLIFDFGSAL